MIGNREREERGLGGKSALVTNRFNNIHRTNGKNQKKTVEFFMNKTNSISTFLLWFLNFTFWAEPRGKNYNKIQVNIQCCAQTNLTLS